MIKNIILFFVTLPPASEQALSFYRLDNLLYALQIALNLLFPAAILFTGLSAKIRSLAQKIGRNWFFTIGLYFIIYSLILFILFFPFSYYSEFVRLHDYNLSNQTFMKWFGNSLKFLLIAMASGSFLLWIPYLIIKKSPKRWWFYLSCLTLPCILFVSFIQPLWIDPLFNHFGPMKNKELEAKILKLADKSGIHGSRVFEVNKSVDTKMVNAYVTGFGKSKRIVLWDTLLEKLDDDEVLFVMGHEMGHYVKGHIVKELILFSGSAFILFFILYKIAPLLTRRFKKRFGFSRLDDVASYPLFIFLITFISFLSDPLFMKISRHYEKEADAFGLEVTQTPQAGATTFVKLQQTNLSNPYPGPIYIFFRASHPPIGERVAFFNDRLDKDSEKREQR